MPTINHPVVGRVEYQVLSEGRLKILTSQHIDTAFIPELKGVPTYGNTKFSGNVPFYGPAIPQLKAAFSVVAKLGLIGKVIFWAGSYVPRLKRGGSTPSNHSFGTAFDINSVQNPFKRPIAPKGAYGSVVELLPIFRALGFECGADWKNTPDGMHFEIKRILSSQEIAAAVARLLGAQAPVTAPLKAVATPEPDLCIWNNQKLDLVMVGNRPYVPIGDLLEAAGHKVTETNNQVEEKHRFYVTSVRRI